MNLSMNTPEPHGVRADSRKITRDFHQKKGEISVNYPSKNLSNMPQKCLKKPVKYTSNNRTSALAVRKEHKAENGKIYFFSHIRRFAIEQHRALFNPPLNLRPRWLCAGMLCAHRQVWHLHQVVNGPHFLVHNTTNRKIGATNKKSGKIVILPNQLQSLYISPYNSIISRIYNPFPVFLSWHRLHNA